MKYCDQCGAQNRDQAKVCTKCGAKFPEVLDAATIVREAHPDLDAAKTIVGPPVPVVLAGRYELVRELGRGAMGIVHLARDQKLGIEIAVKVLPPELGQDPRAIQRLKNEALAAMKLSHPNIVRLINFEEDGATRFLTMEYIDGPTLLGLLAGAPEGKFDLDTFVKYAEQVCAAVAYAHEQNVVHHDLKPANIMVTSKGVVKVTDFGVAHIVRETMTRLSKVETAGTLLYMAPELLQGGRGTPASDQYALGCTFYELLTGEPPFVRGDITFQHLHATPQRIDGIPNALEAMIVRALAKNPADRYPSVRELAVEISRTLGNIIQPATLEKETGDRTLPDSVVAARRTGERAPQPRAVTIKEEGQPTREPVSKRPLGMHLAIAVVAGVATGLISGLLRDHLEASVWIGLALTVAYFVHVALVHRSYRVAGAVGASFQIASLLGAAFSGLLGLGMLELPAAGLLGGLFGVFSVFVARLVRRLKRRREERTEGPTPWLIRALVLGAVAVLLYYFLGFYVPRLTRVAELRTGIPTLIEQKAWDQAETAVNELSRLTPNDPWCDQWRQQIPGALLRTLPVAGDTEHASAVISVAISPDGETLASGNVDSTIKVWRLSDGALLRTLTGHTGSVGSVAISPDGETLVSGSEDSTIKVWRLSDGALLGTLTGHTGSVGSVAISPDGETLASGSEDGTIKVWRLLDGALLRTLTGHTLSVFSVAISPDGAMLVSGGSGDQTIKVWRLSDGTLLRTLTGHAWSVRSVAISPDGETLASGSADNTIKVWRLSDGSLLRTLTGHTDCVRSVAISPDGGTLVSGSADNTVKVWRLSDGALLRTLTGHVWSVNSIAISTDGGMLVSGSGDETIKVWRGFTP